MKKLYFTFALLAIALLSMSAQTKFDTRSFSIANYYRMVKADPSLVKKEIRTDLPFNIEDVARSGKTESEIFLTLSDDFDLRRIEAAGLEVSIMLTDNICIARGSVDDIISLEDVDDVQSMSFPRMYKPLLDKARTGSGVDEVHKGVKNVRSHYNGKGVLCAIYDIGVDPNHINFYDSAFTQSRVKEIYGFAGTSSNPATYTAADGTLSKYGTDNANESHGTHTAGIMAGGYRLSGGKTNKDASGNYIYPQGAFSTLTGTGVANLRNTVNPYYGVAYDADIIMGCGSGYQTNMLTTLRKAIDYGKAHNQPIVFNLSFGGNTGSHDGYDSFGQTLAQLSKDAIICVSSGNEGGENFSMVKKLTATDKELKTCLISKASANGLIEIYGSDKNPFTLKLAIVDKSGNLKGVQSFNSEGNFYYTAPEFSSAYSGSIKITISNNATTSGRRGIELVYSSLVQSSDNAALAIIAEGNAGQRIDIVHSAPTNNTFLSANGISGYTNPSDELSINDMACNENVIAVGSWNSRNVFPSIVQRDYSGYSDCAVDMVSSFTSYGELYDGRMLPDICAPGFVIVSSINSYYTDDPYGMYSSANLTYNNRTYKWGGMQGTSMASPFAAGVIATWLQADPSLTVKKVKEIMKATSDPITGDPRQIGGGGGKLNAIKGLQMILDLNAVNDIKVDVSDIMITPTGANMYEVFVPGGNIRAAVYNMNGQVVKTITESESTLDVDLNNLEKGLYIINVNGCKSAKVAVN